MDRDTELLSAENIWPSPQHGSDEALVPGRSYMTMPVELVGFVAAEGMELRLEVACGDTSFVSDSLRVFYAAPISTASGEQVGEQP